MKTYYTDWDAKKLGDIIDAVRNSSKSESNAEALYHFVWFMKDFGDKNPELKEGEEYEVNIADMYYFNSVVGKDEIEFEFDANTFREFGFTDADMLAVTIYIHEQITGEKAEVKVINIDEEE